MANLSPGLPKHSGTSGLATNHCKVIPVCTDAPFVYGLSPVASPLTHRSAAPAIREPHALQPIAQSPTTQSPGTAASVDFTPRGRRC